MSGPMINFSAKRNKFLKPKKIETQGRLIWPISRVDLATVLLLTSGHWFFGCSGEPITIQGLRNRLSRARIKFSAKKNKFLIPKKIAT